MAQIGNYVHYHYKRYRTYGTSQTGGVSLSAADAYYAQKNDLRASLTQKMSDVQCKELSKFYSNIFYPKNSLKAVTAEGTMDAEELLTALIKKAIETGETSIKEELANLVNSGSITKALRENTRNLAKQYGISKASLNDTDIYLPVSSLRQYKVHIEELLRAFGTMAQNPNLSVTDIVRNKDELTRELMSCYNDLVTAENHFNEQFSKVYKGVGLNTPEYLRKRLTISTIEKETDINLALVQDRIKEIDRKLQGAYAFMFAGDVGELVVALSQYIKNGVIDLAAVNINELFNTLISNNANGTRTWSGNDTSGSVVSNEVADFLVNWETPDGETLYQGDELVKEFNSKLQTVKLDGLRLTFSGTKDTVDVTISTDAIDNSDIKSILGDVDTLNASVKNYSSFGSGVSTISEIPLSTLILTYLNVDFSNHYMNLLGSHSSSADQAAKDHRVKEYKEMVNLALIHRSLSGRGRNNDVLILNERQTQTVTILPTDRLLNDLLDSPQNIDKYFIITRGQPDDLTSWNNWVGGKEDTYPNITNGYIRIKNFLFQLHKVKLSATMKKSALSTYGFST